MRAESGETEARARFEGLFSGHYGELLRFAQRRVGIDAAGDVVAETFLIAWRRLPEVPAEHARAWLYMTARHVIANELRARQRRDRLSGHTRDDIATDRAVAGDHATVIAEQIRVRAVLESLSQMDQEVLRLTEWEQLDLTEAAAVVAAVAATEIAGVIPVPWWHGQAPSAAYAVTKNPDGTVDVTVRWNQLHDPDALNARLRQAGVRAAVMLYSAPRQCRATVALDPTYSTLHVDLRQHPELAKHPRALVAYLRSQDLGSNMIASALAIPTMSRCSRSTPTRSRAVTSSWSSC